LELDYFLAKSDIEYLRLEIRNKNFEDALWRLDNIENIYSRLQSCDQIQIRPLIDQVKADLEWSIVRFSVAAAEKTKEICRVYEDARFPVDELKPDLAYQIAQSVNAESLFLVKRRGRGYVIPLSYNIPVKEAKEIVRRLDRNPKKKLLDVNKDPKVLRIHTGQSLVCVPTNSESDIIMCTCIPGSMLISPRQLEFLLASAEVIDNLVESSARDVGFANAEFFDGDRQIVSKHPRGAFREILTVTQPMIKLIRMAERASMSSETILLEGETGVGKELFAKAIHENSRRKSNPFVAINAGGMPVSLLESQLFGHTKGAFTDAIRERIGLVQEADGGTLFLDEVGEMGPELQVKLLRLLENGEYRRLGENEVRIANVRTVSATNRDLMSEVEQGNFRRDLYYRLGTVKLVIPPLRFRPKDIEVLVRHFLRQSAFRNQQFNRFFDIEVKAMEALELYDWPGNVRELQNEIRRIVTLIGDEDLVRYAMLSRHIKQYLKSKGRSDGLLERSVDRYERRLILDALCKNDWNRLRTAEHLGVPRTTLLAKMRRLNVAPR
jgi:DNA-binding NtrC family response regulator